MRKILFIVNPAAGNGQAKKVLPLIHDQCDGEKLTYDIKVSNRENQITDLVKQSIEKKQYTDLVAVGGDGTIIECINAIVGVNIRLGLIPMGTGNDLARSLDIPKEPEKALRKILKGRLKKVDLGSVNGVIFINSAGVGIDGKIIYDTGKIKKLIPGGSAYTLSTIKSIFAFQPFKVRLTLDGLEVERDAYLIAIGNGQYFGGGMKITPKAKLDSGVFQICLVRKLPRRKFLRVFPKVYKGQHETEPEVETFTCRTIKIDTFNRDLHVSADGNLVSMTPATINMYHEKIEIWH
ncbi:diacylglycerol/lipid kinase family protein [Fusibacter sp. JL216-2]|uniref:diacylglycerol/lipid kinase family protein n=1 Tax=Fusibacter sp. JL216-2 TaxID=3071453 RepID=UPI003D340241